MIRASRRGDVRFLSAIGHRWKKCFHCPSGVQRRGKGCECSVQKGKLKRMLSFAGSVSWQPSANDRMIASDINQNSGTEAVCQNRLGHSATHVGFPPNGYLQEIEGPTRFDLGTSFWELGISDGVRPQVPAPSAWLYPSRPYPSHAWQWDRGHRGTEGWGSGGSWNIWNKSRP